jgi:G3E family GTPase
MARDRDRDRGGGGPFIWNCSGRRNVDLSSSKVVPITILTGFLGAGKTTLLNRILNGDHGLRVAVLVNDFGAINIDAELVIGVQEDVISLANGCVCCTMRDDLVETVVQTINRPEAPEYILLEASGVADPSGIAVTFVDPELRERIRLDSITCVVDADQIFAHPENPAVEHLKLRQIAFADMMILNKTDLAGPEQVRKVRAWTDDHFNGLRIVETSYCDVPLEILLSIGRFDPALEHAGCADANCRNEHHGHDHSATFSTWSYETERPLSLEALREAVRKLPANIYRAKGVVYTSDAPNRRAVLQVVGRRVDISVQGEWDGRVPRTQIVAIGKAGDIDTRRMKGIFTTCIAAAAADIAE